MYIVIVIIWIAHKHVSSDWLTLEDGTERLSWNAGNSLPNLHHVKLQHSKDLDSLALPKVKAEYGC